jgi:hypothetical protein
MVVRFEVFAAVTVENVGSLCISLQRVSIASYG